MKIFWDIDETLIHSRTYQHQHYAQQHIVDVHNELFYVSERPCAKTVIEYSRELFGAENVCILTAAAELYAERINIATGWNFPTSQIFGRETISRYSIKIPCMYGSTTLMSEHPLASRKNVLIDNLRYEWNEEKTNLMLITRENYQTFEDYIGDNEDDEIFRDTVKHFLKTHYEKTKNR
jgi:hypothetical protein